MTICFIVCPLYALFRLQLRLRVKFVIPTNGILITRSTVL